MDLIKNKEIKIILNKLPGQRSTEEVRKIVDILQNLDYFKNQKEFIYPDLEMLAKATKYLKIEKGKNYQVYGGKE